VEVVRTKVSLPALAKISTGEGVVFAGSLGGGYIFPRFLPAFDAVMSLGKLLELLAPQARPLSEQLGEIPTSTLVHKTVACPWALKGTVMRTATEHFQREAADGEATIGLVDGVQLRRDGGWIQLLPDADEPVFHIYAEGTDRRESEELADTFLEVVRGVIREHTE
jgi:mannose-1-phosphate guanylyltransferase/phosphomannomutase